MAEIKKHEEGKCDVCHHPYDNHDIDKLYLDETPCADCPTGICK